MAATAATTTYNPATEDYTIDVRVLARDNSNFIIGYNPANLYPIKRSVPYLVELTSPDGSVSYASRTGTMQLQRSSFLSGEPYAPIPTETLTGIPLVGFARLLVTINPDEPDYQESTRSNNYSIDRIINLNNQDELAEEIVNTSGSGFGPVLPDPGYELSFDSDIVRAGSETTLYWDTKVSYPMECEIIGPTTFAENGVHEFDPSVDGMTGSISTGPLDAAQVFRITCHERITNTTYESETRVDVAGALKEV